MVYKFRVILDTEEDIFRDIAILDTDTLEDLHNTISNAFGFDGNEMASFYTCDDKWNQEDEIPLFDTGETPGEQSTMQNFVLKDILDEQQTKIIYVYDFLNMFTFFVELGAIEEKQNGESYPSLLFAHGDISGIDQNNFEDEFDQENIYNEFEDDFDEDDLDMFGDDDFGGYDDFSDDNWN